MLYIDELGKYYYCPLKRNRLVDDTEGQEDYKRIELLSWGKHGLLSNPPRSATQTSGSSHVYRLVLGQAHTAMSCHCL